MLAEDLRKVTKLAATLEDALQTVSLTTAGKVSRHVVRGPPLWDPKAVKLEEDLACRAGMRDPAEIWRRWPSLWGAMAPLASVILRARAADSEFCDLIGCLGAEPRRQPPRDDAILRLRVEVGRALGLDASTSDQHHRFSPWRYSLVDAVQRVCEDPDRVLPTWLRDGAPMGIRRELEAGGGIFPPLLSDRALTPEAVLNRKTQRNHASFQDYQGEQVPPGHAAVQKHLDSGFALLFENQVAAERHLGSAIAAAPMGCVSKPKDDGTVKHRVIQDLKANGVNLASRTPERQVLPTAFQHARDVAILGGLTREPAAEILTETLVLDVKDAFMGIPLHQDEMAFNACALDLDLVRSRPPLYDGEPRTGAFVVWTVLGFGGKPNPLVFARAAAFAARTGQALFKPVPEAPGCELTGVARLQLYVDDPVFSVSGTTVERAMAVDLLLLWWLTLGLPLAWPKGSWTAGRHRWIGADFEFRAGRGASAAPLGGVTGACCVLSAPLAFPWPATAAMTPSTISTSCSEVREALVLDPGL